MADFVEKTVADIIKAAELCGVDYDKSVIETVVKQYAEKLQAGYVQFRVTNKPAKEGRELNWRYQGRPDKESPWVLAKSLGYTTSLPEADKVMIEGWNAIPTARECVDFHPKYGVAKVWHMHNTWQVFSQVRPQMPSLPAAVDNYIETFKKFDIDRIFVLMGLDRRHPSINLYFGIYKGNRSHQYIKDMITALGFSATDEETKYWEEFDVVSCTFRWDSPRIDRICFYRQLTQQPQGLDPFFDEILSKGLPSTNPSPYYSFGHSFTQSKPYLKFEWDYIKSVNDFEQELYQEVYAAYQARKAAQLAAQQAAEAQNTSSSAGSQ